MKSARDIDDFIREALSPGEGELWDELGEPSLAELVTETFAGRRRLFTGLTWFLTLFFFLSGVYASLQMLDAPDLRGTVVWFAAAALCVVSVIAFKIWNWLEMVRVSVLREVKRVELQLAYLAKKIEAEDGGRS
ncbi:MAG: hypothetical protein OEO23_06855 [Gemmatimonadota bacterium]|nr:hypothetical protein [Gemmatimonadota bacterium]